MSSNLSFIHRILSITCFVIFSLIYQSSITFGQTWNWVYGGNSCRESGYNGVTPVTNCANGGYIACGTSASPLNCGTTDAYVVRVNAQGAKLWEYTYNIGSATNNDTAWSIREDTDGFIVTGTVELISGRNVTINAFLMKLNCSGHVAWARRYGDATTDTVNVYARDVIIAKNSLGGGSQIGDYIVAGWVDSNSSASGHALLFRASKGIGGAGIGNLVWNATYDNGLHEHFNALTEANNSGGSNGDIIAVGMVDVGGSNIDAYIVRVDGSNGAIGPAPQGTASYGTTFREEFNCVTELSIGQEAGNIVAGGNSNQNQNGTRVVDLLIYKFSTDPCTKIAMTLAGDSSDTTRNNRLYGILEVTNAALSNFAPVGDLAITGHSKNGLTGTDAFVLPVNVSTLTPGNGRTFGDNGSLDDVGRSIAQSGGYLIIAGTSQSNLEGANDPEDLFLIKTSGTSGDNCSYSFSVDSLHIRSSDGCLSPTTATPLAHYTTNPDTASHNWGNQVCTCRTCKRTISLPPPSEEQIVVSSGTIASFPNPIHKGDVVSFEMNNDLVGLISIQVVNPTGSSIEGIEAYAPAEGHLISLSTRKWPIGTYFIGFACGDHAQTVKVIVIE